MKKIMIVAVLSLIVSLPSLLMARPHNKFGPGELNTLWAKDDAAFSKLDLTADQQERIQALRKTLERDIAPLREEKYERIAELSLLWKDPNPDGAKIKARMRAFGDLMWRIVEKEVDYRLSFRDILTQYQYERYLSLSDFRRFSRK